MQRVRRWLLVGLAWVGRALVWRAAPPVPRRILVIKPDHLGDVLLSTPALRLLRQRHPTAQIVVLVGGWSAGVLARNPDIDTLLTLPFPGFARGPAGARGWRARLAPYTLLLRMALLLRAGRFDTALLLRDDHWWGAALALLAGVPLRVGHAVPECRPFLTTALPHAPRQHVTEQALAVVAALGGPPPDAPRATLPLRCLPAPDDCAWAAQWCAQQLAPQTTLLVLHAGTGGPAKLWQPARWAAVANALTSDDPRRRVVLTGGPAEAALAHEIAAALRPAPLWLVGTTSVGQLTALLGHAALVLGVDSGPLHLAVSQGTPSVHLFGPSDAARFGPWGDPARHRVLRAGLWCSPCGVFAACPRHTDPPECMAALDEAQVLAAARALLAR